MQFSMVIAGMHCESCVALVRAALAIIESVEIESVELGTALVNFDDTKTTKRELMAAVRQAGSFEISSFITKP